LEYGIYVDSRNILVSIV